MRKTKRQLREESVEKARAIRAILADFTFSADGFLTFPGGNSPQRAWRAVSRADPGERYLVLMCWPDAARDRYFSRLTALCPPGREGRGRLVCESLRAYLAADWALTEGWARGQGRAGCDGEEASL